MKFNNSLVALVFVFTGGLGLFSQNLPIDFESTTTWVGFDGGTMTTISNPHQNSSNQSNKVGKMIKDTGKTWAGAYSDLSQSLDFIANNTFSVKVFSHKSNARLLFKVENKENQNINYAVEKTLTKTNEWETLIFDFSQISFNTYNRITLIFDNGAMGNGGQNDTYYIDDIALYRTGDPLPDCLLNHTGNMPSSSQYELIWADEFDQDGLLCHKNWTYDIGTGSQGWGNFEAQYYTNSPENVYVENGSLNIVAIKSGTSYTSARVKTQHLFSFQYGKIEVRAKLPSTAGTWPAVWLLGSNNPEVGWPSSGEIDIIEQFSNKAVNISTAHWSHNGSHASYGREAAIPDPNGFNTYTFEWTPTALKTTINGNWAWEMTISEISTFHNKFFIIMNLALGGNKGAGDIDPNLLEDTLAVDYIRVYKNNLGSFTLSHKDFIPKQISVVPNREGWMVSSYTQPIHAINMYNLNGQLLKNYEPKSPSYMIENEVISKNIIFVEILYGNQRTVFKLYKSN